MIFLLSDTVSLRCRCLTRALVLHFSYTLMLNDYYCLAANWMLLIYTLTVLKRYKVMAKISEKRSLSCKVLKTLHKDWVRLNIVTCRQNKVLFSNICILSVCKIMYPSISCADNCYIKIENVGWNFDCPPRNSDRLTFVINANSEQWLSALLGVLFQV